MYATLAHFPALPDVLGTKLAAKDNLNGQQSYGNSNNS